MAKKAQKPRSNRANRAPSAPRAKIARVRAGEGNLVKRSARSATSTGPLQPRVKAAKPAEPAVKPRYGNTAARSLILPPKPARKARPVVAPAPRAARIAVLPEALAASAPASWSEAKAALARLGGTALTDEQREAVRAALEGRHSLVLMVNGESAARCYQIPALLFSRPTLVVSPLAYELKARSEALAARGIPSLCLLDDDEAALRAARARVRRGGSLLVFATPEALHDAALRLALAKTGVALVAIEEAHCASDCSHEIRPSYADFKRLLLELGSPLVMALARAATGAVRRDIVEHFGLASPLTLSAPALAANLSVVTRLSRGEGRQAALVRQLSRLSLPGVVFCATAHDVDSVYSALRAASVPAHRQHSGMAAADRAAELVTFNAPGELSVLVALSAFAPGSGLPGFGDAAEGGFGRGGPGAVRPDLRFVVHYQSPASLEQYVREVELAGRDGLPATSVMLHESSHRSLHEVLLAQQRFRATHLADLGRALEAPAQEGRGITLEALALSTGQSRRTTDRLTALLADAGIVHRSSNSISVAGSATDLVDGCRRLGAQLYALREQDGRRLAAVSAFAETTDCKLGFLQRYLGEAESVPCGRCDVCSSDLLAGQASMAPEASSRRAPVSEFSIQPVSAVVPHAHAGGQASAARAGKARQR